MENRKARRKRISVLLGTFLAVLGLAVSGVIGVSAEMAVADAKADVKPGPASFKDVPKSHPFHSDIAWLSARGITTGWPDGTFRPSESVSRAAFAAFLYRMRCEPEWKAPAKSPFKDLPVTHQFYREITWLAAQGITKGWSDGTFRPEEKIGRDAIATFLYRFAGEPEFTATRSFVDTRTSEHRRSIDWMATVGISTGWSDGTFRPAQPTERAAIAAFLHRFADRGFAWCDADVVIADNVVPLEESKPGTDGRPDVVRVGDATVTVDSVKGIAAGTYVVSGANDQAPDGLLRKVTKVEKRGSEYVLATEQAALTDVVKKAYVHATYVLDEAGNWHLKEGGENSFSEIVLQALDMKAKVYEEEGLGWKAEAGIEITVDMKVDWDNIDFSAVARLYTTADVGQVGAGFKKNLLTKELPPLNVPVGPINVAITNTLLSDFSVTTAADLAQLKISGGFDYRFGFRYSTNEGLTWIHEDHSPEPYLGIQSNTDVFSVKASAQIDLRIEMRIYGVFGPNLGVALKAEGEGKLTVVPKGMTVKGAFRLPGKNADLAGTFNAKVTVPLSGKFVLKIPEINVFDGIKFKTVWEEEFVNANLVTLYEKSFNVPIDTQPSGASEAEAYVEAARLYGEILDGLKPSTFRFAQWGLNGYEGNYYITYDGRKQPLFDSHPLLPAYSSYRLHDLDADGMPELIVDFAQDSNELHETRVWSASSDGKKVSEIRPAFVWGDLSEYRVLEDGRIEVGVGLDDCPSYGMPYSSVLLRKSGNALVEEFNTFYGGGANETCTCNNHGQRVAFAPVKSKNLTDREPLEKLASVTTKAQAMSMFDGMPDNVAEAVEEVLREVNESGYDGSHPSYYAVRDVNGDGNPELFILKYTYGLIQNHYAFVRSILDNGKRVTGDQRIFSSDSSQGDLSFSKAGRGFYYSEWYGGVGWYLPYTVRVEDSLLVKGQWLSWDSRSQGAAQPEFVGDLENIDWTATNDLSALETWR